MISPGRCKLGGIGGDRAAQIYAPGRIGVCSRSGGMSAEIIVGMRMVEVLKLFEASSRSATPPE